MSEQEEKGRSPAEDVNGRRTLVVILVLLALVLGASWWHNRPVVLHLGIFAGSGWDVPGGKNYRLIDEAIARFEAENPGVKVEYTSGVLREDYSSWLADAFMEGREPDVFIVPGEDFNTLSSIGALMDLSFSINRDATFTKSAYYESAIETGTYLDRQYALPYESNPTLMFVNKTLLEREGIPVPQDGWTLGEFYDICRRVTRDTDGDGQVDQYGCYGYTWRDSVYGHGLTLFNQEGTTSYLDDAGVRDAIAFVRSLNELNEGHTITATEFDMGQVAFAPMPFSQYRVYKPYPWRVQKYSSFVWDCVRMPSVQNVRNSGEASALLMAISARTSYPVQAWNLLKALSYDERSQKDIFSYSQGISSLKAVTRSPEVLEALNQESQGDTAVNLSLLNDVMEETVSHHRFKKYDSAMSLIDTRVEKLMHDGGDLDTSLIELQRDVDRYLRE